MIMTPVSSSNVARIGFENGVLRVQFHNGYVYEYYNVPESVYKAFLNAPSKGQFVHYNLKGFYDYRRIA